jgi:dTDP-4-amino-4,6-dideoxygalactose transaminase
MAVPFIDLNAAFHDSAAEVRTAVERVLASGRYILGEEVARFEHEFAAFCEVQECVGVASGTDALLLALKAHDVGPGDEVITVAHTAVATVAAIELSGAMPVFVDIDPRSYTLDPQALPAALSGRSRAIIPVHIYGHPADMTEIMRFAARNNLIVIEDCAQAHGARFAGKRVGGFGSAAAFSFYPTKNLGAIGDAGAIVTNDHVLAERLRALRQYGWRTRYVSDEPGYNSRLDELQAAILCARLRHLPESNMIRRRIAADYADRLAYLPITRPGITLGVDHVYHLFVIQSEHRDALQQHLADNGIGSAIHYPVPVHLQPAYAHLGLGPGSLPVTEALAGRVLSLPMYPHMPATHVEAVVSAVSEFAPSPA